MTIEPTIEPGGPLTSEALDAVADWLDQLDELAKACIGLLAAHGVKSAQEPQEILEILNGTSMQDDLRRWATELWFGEDVPFHGRPCDG